jgi:hypothetical protein
MNYLPPAADLIPVIPRNLSYDRLTSALNLFCGRGRRYSVQELSKATGVPERIIEAAKYQSHQAEFRPLRFDHLQSMNNFLRVPFVSHYLEQVGLGAYELMDEQPLPSVLTADSAKPSETPQEKVERLKIELFRAIEELTA